MPIRLLPAEVAGKIAAGEVIDRPASVAKELVENSIDAGATAIRVEIADGGRRLIRVADDGSGIPAAEVPLAFARHATSKLTSVADLDRILTLGFRGEALASIAAVSHVTVLTRPASQTMGRYVRVESGQVTREEGRGCPVGTVLTVEHLFRNVPARLKFLRQAQTEAGHIQAVVTNYAVAHPHLRFSLTIDGRVSFQSSGNGRRYDVLLALYGLEMVEEMLRIEPSKGSHPGPSVSGYAGTPSLHRASRRHITIFVNRRWIQDRSLSHAVAQAYHTLLPVGRHPVSVIVLEMDPAEVDVNVHPTKREVRFRDGRLVFNAVQRAVRRTLLDQAPVASLAPSGRAWPTPEWGQRADVPSTTEMQTGSTQFALELCRPADGSEEPQPVGPVRLPLLRVVGQIGQTYIVAEGPQGMYLVDQHASHERVLYEKLTAERTQQRVASQAMLEPVVLNLDPLLAGTLTEYVTQLAATGFDIEPFGGSSYLLRSVPTVLAVPDVQAALVDILELLRLGDDRLAGEAEERLIAAVCKRAAIKAGQTLSQQEMERLIRGLEQCASPRTCPHGRPTILHFSVEQLEKGFGRR